MLSDVKIGTLLIAEPFLKDPAFMRSVVLVCRHTADEGSFGFVLNKRFDKNLDELIPELLIGDFPVYVGGPVQMDTLHYIHQYPQYFNDAQEVAPDIYWGGDFDILKSLINNQQIEPNKIRFFLGYSGWGVDQLEDEMKEKSWLTVDATPTIVFHPHIEDIWKLSLFELGGQYKMMANFPTDPQLN